MKSFRVQVNISDVEEEMSFDFIMESESIERAYSELMDAVDI